MCRLCLPPGLLPCTSSSAASSRVPSLSTTIVLRRHRCPTQLPPQSLLTICYLFCLSSMSLVPIVSCWQLPSLQFLVCRHRHFLLAADILTIYPPPLPCLLLPPPSPIRGRALSLPSSSPVRHCCRLLPETVVTHHHHPYSSNTASAHHSRPSRILPPKKTC